MKQNVDDCVLIFFRPELHGAEFVKLLSQILNQCGSKQGGQSCALALQGITALCNAKIVNIATTWEALAPRLSRDKRPVVIKR
jgi:chloramphenicol 3-O-phosphotransferase